MQKGRNLSVPEGLDGAVVLRELSKAIRNAERLINTLNPPKPERESKRMKKKPVNKDFVDLSQPLNAKNAQEVCYCSVILFGCFINVCFAESQPQSHQQQNGFSLRVCGFWSTCSGAKGGAYARTESWAC